MRAFSLFSTAMGIAISIIRCVHSSRPNETLSIDSNEAGMPTPLMHNLRVDPGEGPTNYICTFQ